MVDARSNQCETLISSLKDCGVRADWYTYVFAGVISAVTGLENDEKQIQLVPEEVFLGTPATPLTVSTSRRTAYPNSESGLDGSFAFERWRVSRSFWTITETIAFPSLMPRTGSRHSAA